MKKFLSETFGQALYAILIIACFIAGFSPWLNWLKYHASNDQNIMVILDVLGFFILIPINGAIVIYKFITGLMF
jgi:hypothetical protein